MNGLLGVECNFMSTTLLQRKRPWPPSDMSACVRTPKRTGVIHIHDGHEFDLGGTLEREPASPICVDKYSWLVDG